MTDVKAALRALNANRWWSAVVILTMAVAIAANTAIFSVYDQLVLHPVTIPDPSSLVAIWFNNPQRNVQTPSISIPRYRELREASTSFSSMGLSAFDAFTLTGGAEATQLTALRVSASFFPTLGVAPARGRNFSAEEDVPNGPKVCLVSHELWQGQFAGRESIVGETIQLNNESWEVVGVMPPKLSVPFGQVQVFAPRVFDVSGLTPAQIDSGATYAQAIGRVKPGASSDHIRLELTAFSADYKARHPGSIDANNISEARDYVGSLVSGLQPTMYALLGGVACVLLIACANVASLFLSRLVKRRKEIAVRLSLGATRSAIVRQFQMESLVFSTAGGVLGVGLAMAALSALQSVAASQLPANVVLSLNWRALLVTIALTLVSAVFIGLVPALQASRAGVVDQLKDGGRGTSSGAGRTFRQWLTVAEVMLSVVLLVGAGLLLSSFAALQRTSAGFEPKGAAAAFVGLSPSRYAPGPPQLNFFEQLIPALRAQPGVTMAAVSLATPLSGNPRLTYGIAGQPLPPPGQRPVINMNVVSDDYFTLLEIPLAAGRTFNTDDLPNSPSVCVVNATFASRAFPGASAIGQALVIGPANRRIDIVGVIRDVKSNGVNAPTPEEAYFPLRQLPRGGLNVIAKTTGDAAALQTAMRAAVAAVDKTQAIAFFGTFESNVALSLGTQRLVATLTGLFAAIALVLSLTGLYSVLAFLVSQRTPEIGIRMALGATRQEVIRLVMRSGMMLVAIGLILGLGGAAAASRLIQQLLFGVNPLSIAIYAGVALIFAVVGALACLGPSLRASRIDPLVAFRAD